MVVVGIGVQGLLVVVLVALGKILQDITVQIGSITRL